jgi:hypothetical protein
MLASLHAAGVEFIVVGGTAAVMLGAPVSTQDLDIVHRRSPENVTRLLDWLLAHDAYHRFDIANRHIAPTVALLSGNGHINLQTDLGKLDVLCELAPGEGFDDLLPDTVLFRSDRAEIKVLSLARLVDVKARTGRAKDRAMLPLLIAALEEDKKRSK